MRVIAIAPLLLRPKVLAFRNRCRHSLRHRTLLWRDIIVALFTAAVIGSIYHGTRIGLQKILVNGDAAYLPPALPLGLLLLMLFGMLLLSNSVAALGALFLARDLDLILASPITPARFFRSKLVEVALHSSWIALIFGFPAIVAFGVAYDAPWSFYPLSVAILLPYFIIPAAIAMILVIGFTLIVPANRTREVLLATGALILACLYLLCDLIAPRASMLGNLDELLRVAAILSLPNVSWSPSYWASQALGGLLTAGMVPVYLHVTLLYLVAGTLTGGAALAVYLGHGRAWSRARNNRRGTHPGSRSFRWRLLSLTGRIDQQVCGIVAKEYRVFARDMTQAIQLVLLLGLCLLYLYNFRILHAVQGLPPATRVWWQAFLVISNVGMGAFVITAVCTRFVFPSISLEGQSWWLLQTAPISTAKALRAKFWCWFIPVGAISSVIFSAGALAIHADPGVIIVNALSSWILCYGLVGLAVGLGACFANFEWEHASQLAASFGSLIFMLCGTILIFSSLVPVLVLVFLQSFDNLGHELSTVEWYVALACTAFLLAWMNYAAKRWALAAGERALSARLG